MQGFKDFILRGNLVELAVAFIMGAAFKGVVDSFTNIRVVTMTGMFFLSLFGSFQLIKIPLTAG